MKHDWWTAASFCSADAGRLKQFAVIVTGSNIEDRESTPMLSEKFILLLETIRRQQDEGRVVSTSPHVPVVLPAPKRG